ncbi:MAG: lycopene cyclase domain-containing protein [Microbacterium sp.]|uniref:lycopene cyclase domain-containing protein n=1 Tax=Microbacterium sp. TaxID=51671 RepID=UPI001ACF9093|nr:lycopene cyclase domain-containing protein [Microbacterium sp.]MBN9152430.1 lycopene cyclase domain-containing protein [Microbacterium sp.]MBN9170213.1 lycopene cyclase domain-containing protein [Microbacterium sp.]MBN9179299.1 lycopene cyclase domain-containing protein [Microbacterium sp.]MBN9181636.1 lycopene cyclase domain-containing protein [Microbacterium sp.]MBN9184275.1 lycopene cyclase domain-containing protein [Microbacterium sp.]
MSVAYLGILVVLLGCMTALDARLRLFFWRDALAATVVMVCGVGVLLLTDLVGIALGIFSRAPTRAMTGIVLAPELPLEEPVFLAFLVYVTMNLVAIAGMLLARGRAGR